MMISIDRIPFHQDEMNNTKNGKNHNCNHLSKQESMK